MAVQLVALAAWLSVLPLSIVCWCLAVQINLLIPSITWLLESSSFSLGFLLRKITAKGKTASKATAFHHVFVHYVVPPSTVRVWVKQGAQSRLGCRKTGKSGVNHTWAHKTSSPFLHTRLVTQGYISLIYTHCWCLTGHKGHQIELMNNWRARMWDLVS